MHEEKKNIETVGQEDLLQGQGESKELVLRYEELRMQALNNSVHQVCLGLSLFVRRGMLLWMTSWSMCMNSPMDCRRNEEDFTINGEPENVNSEIVTIVADIFLSLEQQGGWYAS